VIVYLDTSALVKRFVQENKTQEVNQLIQQADIAGSSSLTQVEMASALTKAVRLTWVPARDAENAWQDFVLQWPDFVRTPVSNIIIERASQLAWKYGLRGYDALHLATALIWQESMETNVTLATFDHELWLAGKKAGIDPWPANL